MLYQATYAFVFANVFVSTRPKKVNWMLLSVFAVSTMFWAKMPDWHQNIQGGHKPGKPAKIREFEKLSKSQGKLREM